MRCLNNRMIPTDIPSVAKELAHSPEKLARLFDAISGELMDDDTRIRSLGVLAANKASSKGKWCVEVLGQTAKMVDKK